MKRVLLAVVVAAIAGASCVRHVDLASVDSTVDAPATPDAAIDASTVDASFTTVDASFTPVDAAPDSAIHAL